MSEDATQKDYMLSQEQTRYTTVSATNKKRCANCQWFRPYGSGRDTIADCHLVAAYPEPILATGKCDRWEAKVPAPGYESPAKPVYIVEEPESAEMSHERSEGDGYIAPTTPNLIQRAKTALTGGLNPGQTVLKAADGQRLLFMVTSNSYPDRERETILSDALKQYVDSSWVEGGGFVGEQQHYIWHAKELGSISDLLYADLWGAFLVEIWKEKPHALAKAYYDYLETTDEPQGASHGFKFLRSDRTGDGDYRAIRKEESSSLPLSAAANLLTFSGVITKMSKRDDFLKGLFKEQLGIEIDPADVQGDFKGAMDKLAAAGVQHKANDDAQTGGGFTPEIAGLVMKLAEHQADTIGELDTLSTRLDGFETAQKEKAEADQTAQQATTEALAALTTSIKAIEESLQQQPRASQNDATVVTDEGDKAKVNKSMPDAHDPFWADLNVAPSGNQ